MSSLGFVLICGLIVLVVAGSALLIDRADVWPQLVDESRMSRWFLTTLATTVVVAAGASLLGASHGILIGIGVVGGALMAVSGRLWAIAYWNRREHE